MLVPLFSVNCLTQVLKAAAAAARVCGCAVGLGSADSVGSDIGDVEVEVIGGVSAAGALETGTGAAQPDRVTTASSRANVGVERVHLGAHPCKPATGDVVTRRRVETAQPADRGDLSLTQRHVRDPEHQGPHHAGIDLINP